MKSTREFRQRFALLAVGFAAGAIALGGWIAVWNHSHPPATPAFVAVPSAPAPGNPATLMDAVHAMPGMGEAAPLIADPVVARVAARFQCTCPDHCALTLDRCSCATAAEERSFLSGQFQLGHSEAEAIEALDKKFGGIRM